MLINQFSSMSYSSSTNICFLIFCCYCCVCCDVIPNTHMVTVGSFKSLFRYQFLSGAFLTTVLSVETPCSETHITSVHCARHKVSDLFVLFPFSHSFSTRMQGPWFYWVLFLRCLDTLDLFLSMCMYLYVCLSHVCGFPHRPEEIVGSSEPGATSHLKAAYCGCWEPNPDSLEEQ